MTNTESNKARVREFIQLVLSGGDAEGSDRYFDTGFVDHQPWPGHAGTVEGFKAGLKEMRQAFPDLRLEVERLSAEGDLVTILYSMSATHLGPFLGAPGSGRTFKVEGLDLVRMRDGRLAEHWGFFDTEAMARQLGLGPPAA